MHSRLHQRVWTTPQQPPRSKGRSCGRVPSIISTGRLPFAGYDRGAERLMAVVSLSRRAR